MKPNCNKLSIGAPGTEHIKWMCAGQFVANSYASVVNRMVALRELGFAKKSKKTSSGLIIPLFPNQPKTAAGDSRSSRPSAAVSISRFALLAFICVHLCSSVVQASVLTLALTNSLGQPDTNVIRIVQTDTNTPALANGQPVTIGLPARLTPDTNGIVTVFRLLGNYTFYGPTLGAGVIYRFPDSSSNATAYPLSGFNTFQTVVIATNNASQFDTNGAANAVYSNNAAGYQTATQVAAARVLLATNAPDGNVSASLNQSTNIALVAAQKATNGLPANIWTLGTASAQNTNVFLGTNFAVTTLNGLTNKFSVDSTGKGTLTIGSTNSTSGGVTNGAGLNYPAPGQSGSLVGNGAGVGGLGGFLLYPNSGAGASYLAKYDTINGVQLYYPDPDGGGSTLMADQSHNLYVPSGLYDGNQNIGNQGAILTGSGHGAVYWNNYVTATQPYSDSALFSIASHDYGDGNSGSVSIGNIDAGGYTGNPNNGLVMNAQAGYTTITMDADAGDASFSGKLNVGSAFVSSLIVTNQTALNAVSATSLNDFGAANVNTLTVTNQTTLAGVTVSGALSTGGNLDVTGTVHSTGNYTNDATIFAATAVKEQAKDLAPHLTSSVATSGTVTASTSYWNETVYLAAGSTIASITIALPSSGTLVGQIYRIHTKSIVTTLSVTGGFFVDAAVVALTAGQTIAYQAQSTSGAYIRIQ